jgi:hypothetical protein
MIGPYQAGSSSTIRIEISVIAEDLGGEREE